jgi:hypothetical protein
MPLKADYLKFVDKFVHERDVSKAAMSAGFTAKYGHKLYAMPEVRAEIDARMEVLNAVKAHLTANTELGKEVVQLRKLVADRRLEIVKMPGATQGNECTKPMRGTRKV